MDFSAIQSKVRDYLVDLPTETNALVADWVNHALRTVQDRHNFRAMEAQADFVTVADARVLGAKPSDWKEFRLLPWLETADGATREIRWASSISEMVRGFGVSSDHDTGTPRALLETPTELHVWPLPDGRSQWGDGEYRLRVPYWRFLPPMTAGATESFFTRDMGWALVFLAVADGMIFNREEERAAVFISKAEQEIGRAVGLDRRSRIGERQTLHVNRMFSQRRRVMWR
ncbi:MAG: hypothetical protein EA405_13635 [Rhodospirillales bacterium]|nr:MAG: hypothetical protein EA405_13635 [Rhodospirillales bacterium]